MGLKKFLPSVSIFWGINTCWTLLLLRAPIYVELLTEKSFKLSGLLSSR